MILAQVNDSCFSIGGYPYAKGSVIPVYDDVANGKIALRRVEWPSRNLFGSLHYSKYIDGSTGQPFASMSALVGWMEDNFFTMPVGGSGGTTLAFTKHLFVKAVPALDDEVAPGATIEHEFLNTGTLQVLYLNKAMFDTDDFTHTTGTPGSVSLDNEAQFYDGDVILLLKNP